MTKQLPRPSARHISSLDGFRGLGFLLVFLRHYTLTRHLTSHTAHLISHVCEGGWIGVDLFFALSGFLITGILLDTRQTAGYFRNFFARRTLRIFPLYYGVFFVLFLLTPLLHLQWQTGHIAYLFYFGNVAYLLNPSLATVLPDVSLIHMWSLSVEEQFYLLWPIIVFFVSRRKHLAMVCAGLSLFALALRGVLLLTMPQGLAFEWNYALLPTHMDGLLYGALAALWTRSRPLESILPIARRVSLASAAVVIVIIAFTSFNFHSVAMNLAGFPALAALFTSILLQALSPGSWASRLGSIRFLRFFGKYSYGLYFYHMIFEPGVAKTVPVFQRLTGSIVLGGVVFLVCVFTGYILLAMLSYHFYEKRWLTLKRFFEYKEPAPVAAPSLAIGSSAS